MLKGKFITKIGCYWRCGTSGQWLSTGNTFTLHIIKSEDLNLFPNTDLLSSARKSIEVTVVLSTWNAYDYVEVDINEQLSDDETIVFGSPTDTVSPVFYQNLPIPATPFKHQMIRPFTMVHRPQQEAHYSFWILISMSMN